MSDISLCATDAQCEVKAEEQCSGFRYFNEDLVCCHYLHNPQAAVLYVPSDTYDQLVDLCGEDVHPATICDDFLLCSECQVNVVRCGLAPSVAID